MIVVPGKFVFLHFPKTAGTWALQTLMGYKQADPRSLWARNGLPAVNLVNTYFHVSIDYLPKEFHDLPRFGFVRHPYTWYPSYSVERGVPVDHLINDGAWTYHCDNTFDPKARIYKFEDNIYEVWSKYTGIPEREIASLQHTRVRKDKPALTNEQRERINNTDLLARGWYDLG